MLVADIAEVGHKMDVSNVTRTSHCSEYIINDHSCRKTDDRTSFLFCLFKLCDFKNGFILLLQITLSQAFSMDVYELGS